MALTADTFSIGDKALVSQQYELLLNFNDGDGWQFVCNTGLQEQLNESIATFFLLCGEGNSTNEITTTDYTIPLESLLVKGDITNKLYKARFDKQFRSNIGVRLNNTLMDQRTEFSGILTLTEIGGVSEDIAMISGEIKVAQGAVVVTDGIPVGTTGTLHSVIDITDVSARVLYSVDGSATISLYETTDLNTVIGTPVSVSLGEFQDVEFLTLTSLTGYTIKLFDNEDTLLDTLEFTTL